MNNMANAKQVIIYEMDVCSLMKGLLMKRAGSRIYYHGISSVVLTAFFKFPIVKNILNSIVKKHIPDKYISEYEGSFFMIENLAVDLTASFFSDMRIADRMGVRAYKEHYCTGRIDTVIKFFIQDKIRNFLRFFYQARRSGDGIFIIIPEKEIYRHVLGKNPFGELKPLNLAFSGIQIFSMFHGLILLMAGIASNAMLLLKGRYTLHHINKKKYRVCMRAHIPKNEGLLRNDFLIDGKEIHTDDVLFFIENGESAHGRQMIDYYKKNNYRFTVLDELRVPVSSLQLMFSDYILLLLRVFVLYLFGREWTSFNALLVFSRTALRIRYERLFHHYNIGLMILFHSAGAEVVIAPVLCVRHRSKFGIYNFGTTVSWGRWAPYAFQTADYYVTRGENIGSLYSPTCDFKEVIKAGFWGKEEYQKICSKRDTLKKEIAGNCRGNRIITFYDIPYFYERSTFTAKHLFDFYSATIACSMLDNVTVILKMKSTHNIDSAKYPADIKPLFDKLWGDIKNRGNMLILDTSMYDPLHIIAISDINVTLEMSSPSTIALICGEAGIFYNVIFDYANHSLYPKYFDRVIFNDTGKLVDAIKKHLNGEIDLKSIVEDNDLRGYDECRDSRGLERLRRAVLERTN